MRQYKVGDKVTIRSWESMEREFGADGSGDLNYGFVSAMRHLCGTSTAISTVYKSGIYNVSNGEFFSFTPQMFTDWETDNAKEMKMQYNGQEVETITKGYWPEGVTLICSDDGIDWNPLLDVVCLHDCHVFYKNAEVGLRWKYWALLPAKPAPRRLTNREVAKLCKKGWDVYKGGHIGCALWYGEQDENMEVECELKLRAPDSDEWLEPTSDLLEPSK